jgi:hemerythrin-like metal-binding protein
MIQWNESLQTGHAAIDADHRRLFGLLQKLGDSLQAPADTGALSELLLTFHRHVRAHFEREETHMLEHGCPAYARNQSEHRRFAALLDDWATRCAQEGPTKALAFDVYHGTGNWLSAHIRTTDCDLRECLRRVPLEPGSGHPFATVHAAAR